MEKGIDVYIEDDDEETPMSLAFACQAADVLDLFSKCGLREEDDSNDSDDDTEEDTEEGDRISEHLPCHLFWRF
ncbi:Uu.00g057400.m01.CDS01 [Anthostomella pinea]|uniref:Uu.00g057400.m01.CDS01 n=1 Tax=Anthostomella pinea TaxID=933095 RepID=A0AAI8VRP4_9PEZI|nr:Uu.00g057400.m01.CDS01 [Anthostomella pinea]